MNALESLQQHFARLDRKEITHAQIPFPLYAAPLTMEDHLIVKAANEAKSPSTQALRIAEFLCGKLKLADGMPAFHAPQGGAAKILTQSVDPNVIWDLLKQVMADTTTDAVSDLEKKSEPQGEAS